jgi:hypothetical protein
MEVRDLLVGKGGIDEDQQSTQRRLQSICATFSGEHIQSIAVVVDVESSTAYAGQHTIHKEVRRSTIGYTSCETSSAAIVDIERRGRDTIEEADGRRVRQEQIVVASGSQRS